MSPYQPPFTIKLYQHGNELAPETKPGDAKAEQLREALATYQDNATPPLAAIFRHVEHSDWLEKVERVGAELRNRFKAMVVVGCGGSGLSARAMAILKHGIEQQRGQQQLHVLDNLDPSRLQHLLDSPDLPEYCFVVVSKSGNTLETLTQASCIIQTMKKRGITAWAKQFIAITADPRSPLAVLAQDNAIQLLPHDPDIGGRFSIMSEAGFLPAAFAGLDTRRLQAGSAHMWTHLRGEGATLVIANTLLQYHNWQEGKPMHICMPYSEQLWGFALWWRQSWAESLAKQGKGTAPICSIGTRDQHSQLQLYLDGPKDKFFTLLLPDWQQKGSFIEDDTNLSLKYLAGKHAGDIVAAEQLATSQTLIKQGVPVRVIHVPTIDEYTLGALLMYFTIEIVLMAELWNINPFDQPAVEESKRLAHHYLTTKMP